MTPWYVPILLGALSTISFGFASWVAVQVIQLRAKVVELESRVNSQEKHCGERLEWIRTMDKKLDKVSDGISKIYGYLERKDS